MDAELEDWKSAGQYFDMGFDVFYRLEGSGPRLLLIHGYPFNSWDWAPIWPTLTKRLTVIAPDMLESDEYEDAGTLAPLCRYRSRNSKRRQVGGAPRPRC